MIYLLCIDKTHQHIMEHVVQLVKVTQGYLWVNVEDRDKVNTEGFGESLQL